MKIQLLIILPLTAALLSAAELKTEHFDHDPGWEGVNNRLVPEKPIQVKQDFGYRATQIAGATAGEIGGAVQRSTTPAYYAKEMPKLSLEDKLSMSGSFAITKSQGSSGIFFGFFNSQQPGGSGRPIGSLGMDFDFEGSGGRMAVRLITGTNKTCGTFTTPYLPGKYREAVLRNDGTRYRWSVDYDPKGAGGVGQMKITLTSTQHPFTELDAKVTGPSREEGLMRFPYTTAWTVDLSPEIRQEGATFDRFGILNMMKSGGTTHMYFGDLVLNGKAVDLTQDPGWNGTGNHAQFEDWEVTGYHNFGYSPESQFAGGAKAGEAGGGLWRSGDFGYYADRVGPLNLDQPLEARGKVRIVTVGPDSDMNIGWFSSEAVQNPKEEVDQRNFLGIHVGGPTRIGHYFIPVAASANNRRTKVETGPIIRPGTVYDWSIAYDPTANGGLGVVTVKLGEESSTLKLTKDQRVGNAKLDRFGFSTLTSGGQMVKIYLDDVTYTK